MYMMKYVYKYVRIKQVYVDDSLTAKTVKLISLKICIYKIHVVIL